MRAMLQWPVTDFGRRETNQRQINMERKERSEQREEQRRNEEIKR
jgi:hypothetical protein